MLIIHALCGYMYIMITIGSLITARYYDLASFMLFLSPFSAIPHLIKISPRWFHINISSIMTCMWCITFIQFPDWLMSIWCISLIHFAYRTSQMKIFKSDKVYKMIPTFWGLPCTVLTEIAKFGVQHDKHALMLGLCSNLAIFGTILAKKGYLIGNQFMTYNICITFATFAYLFT